MYKRSRIINKKYWSLDQGNIDQHLHTHICLIKYEQKWVKWFQDNNRRGCFIKNGFPRLGSLPFCTGFTKWKLQESIGSVVVWVICVHLLAISRLICQPLIPGRLGKLLCQAIYTLMSTWAYMPCHSHFYECMSLSTRSFTPWLVCRLIRQVTHIDRSHT